MIRIIRMLQIDNFKPYPSQLILLQDSEESFRATAGSSPHFASRQSSACFLLRSLTIRSPLSWALPIYISHTHSLYESMKWVSVASLALLVTVSGAFTARLPNKSVPGKTNLLLPRYAVDAPANDSSFRNFEASLEEEDFPEEEPWQAKLEMLLEPTTPLSKRQILLSELLAANQEIRDAVQAALRNRNVSLVHMCMCRVVDSALSGFLNPYFTSKTTL
jgi:hypothetical protein